jgi:thiamine pyrophosphokinase
MEEPNELEGSDSRVLLVLNGDIPDRRIMDALMVSHSLVVSADGATNRLLEMKMAPHVVIGDLDSILPSFRAAIAATTTVVERPDQYSTDFEKALIYIRERGFKSISLVGVKGGRFDHQITNLSVIRQFSLEFDFVLHDDDGIGYVLSERTPHWSQDVPSETIVSLLPLSEVRGITTEQLKYPLKNETLTFGMRNGQSNVSLGGTVSISLKAGALICYLLQTSERPEHE